MQTTDTQRENRIVHTYVLIYWRPVVERSVRAFLRCGDLHDRFARVRCGECGQEMCVAFSCKQRCVCPSCHQKRTLLAAIHVAEDVCALVAHRPSRSCPPAGTMQRR